MSAELAARRTAAAAVLGDFRSEYGRFLADPVNLRSPDYPVWVLRLAAELASVLQRLDDEAAAAAPAVTVSPERYAVMVRALDDAEILHRTSGDPGQAEEYGRVSGEIAKEAGW